MEFKKFLIIGSNGQLGRDLIKILENRKEKFTGLTHKDFELKDYEQVKEVISELKPEIVINTAAFHSVDKCEEQPHEAYTVNCECVVNLAKVCRDNNCKLVHISTDYVFDGKKNRGYEYSEEDIPNPVNTYGKSKLSGEVGIKSHMEKYFIIRTAALHGISKSSVKGSNFIETMIRLSSERGKIEVVDDQITSPTYTVHLANTIIDLCNGEHYGLYHITSEGSCSWFEFAKEIFKQEELKVESIPITTFEAAKKFNYKAERPLNAVLSKNLIRNLEIKMPDWQIALSLYLKERRCKNG